MSLCTHSRRLARPATALLCSKGASFTLAIRSPALSIRAASSTPTDSKQQSASVAETIDPKGKPNYLKNYEDAKREAAKLTQEELRPSGGTMSRGSVFSDEVTQAESSPPGELEVEESQKKSTSPLEISRRNLEGMSRTLDPNPIARKRWQRKKVIEAVKKRYKLSKVEVIKQTERESSHHSDWWFTSTKKLGMLARQISGKTYEEAMVQMRFSKKRHAVPIRIFLDEARNEAIVRRGLGLGEKEETPQEIELKNGKRYQVKDKSEIYIDRAWVVRGKIEKEPEYRAKGKVNVLKHRRTRLHVTFKEDATRIRLAKEQQEKRDNRKLWVHLPDRPITDQRQYCLW